MNPTVIVDCVRCGGKAEAQVVPDTFEENPATFTLTEACKAGCPKTYKQISAQQARDLTKHSYDGATGQWSKLPAGNRAS